jgi:hypothetical protein
MNDLSNEITNIKHDLMLSEYPKEFIDSVLKPITRNRPPSDRTYHGTVVIPYVKGIAEKFRRIGNRFQIRTIFKTKHTLRSTLMKTGPIRNAQQTKKCVYSIPCECGRCYIGETSRSLEVEPTGGRGGEIITCWVVLHVLILLEWDKVHH